MLRERRRQGELSLRNRDAWTFLTRETLHLAVSKGLVNKSAALTYTFILSIVPLLAIAFTFFKGFGGLQVLVDQTIKPLVATHFAANVAQQLSEFLDYLLGQLDTKALSVVSFVTFLGTVVALLMNVEGCLNEVFGARKERSVVRKFINYWVFFSFTPVIVALSSVKSTQIMSTLGFARETLDTFGLLGVLRYVFGMGVQLAGFLILYGFMPNRRTGWIPLLLGAATATLLFEGLQFVNVMLTRQSFSDSSTSAIYGTIPLLAVAFFVWIRLVWMVVLAGACVAMAASNLFDENAEQAGHAGVSADLDACARLFEDACARFEADEAPAAFESLYEARGVARAEAERVLSWLVEARLLVTHEKGSSTLLVPTPKGTRLRGDARGFVREIVKAGFDRVALAPGGDSTSASPMPSASSSTPHSQTPGDAFARQVMASLEESIR
jgi:membrane protein